ncbi:MAG: hypothetical protein Q8N56_03655 [bacterium]|nr:hypothetical protein [bacterium]
MDKEFLFDIRNKLTAPKIALEKLTKGEKLPREYLELALRELNAAVIELNERKAESR